jgi:hypothetical protein
MEDKLKQGGIGMWPGGRLFGIWWTDGKEYQQIGVLSDPSEVGVKIKAGDEMSLKVDGGCRTTRIPRDETQDDSAPA